MAVSSRDIGREILKCLGITERCVASVTIHVKANDGVRITTERFVGRGEEVTGPLRKIMENYELHKRPNVANRDEGE